MNNRRNTKQRELILAIVRSMRSHPSADEVYAVAKHSMPNISLGTVYRNLRLLVEDKELGEVRTSGSITRYDAIVDEHEHFLCKRCNRLIDILASFSAAEFARKQGLAGCTVSGYSLQIFGLCPDCSNNASL